MHIDFSDPHVWDASPVVWLFVIAMGIVFLVALIAAIWAALRKNRDAKQQGTLRWRLNLATWGGWLVLPLLLAAYPWHGSAMSIRGFFLVLSIVSLVMLVRVWRWPAISR
jgi:hypothetical protein